MSDICDRECEVCAAKGVLVLLDDFGRWTCAACAEMRPGRQHLVSKEARKAAREAT
jgi:hypothetical protein